MMQSFIVHVAIIVNMLHPRSQHVASVPCEFSKLDLIFLMLQTLIFNVAGVESQCRRHVMLDVANIKFSMLRMLSFDVTDI
jgi:hypothetical protein